MNLCIDCAHHRDGDRCAKGDPDYVRGDVNKFGGGSWRGSCQLQRNDGWFGSRVVMQTCGRDARWFKPKAECVHAIGKKP